MIKSLLFSLRISWNQVFVNCRQINWKILVMKFILRLKQLAFTQICRYFFRFLYILGTSISQNTFRWRHLPDVRISRYSFPQKIYNQDRKLGTEKT